MSLNYFKNFVFGRIDFCKHFAYVANIFRKGVCRIYIKDFSCCTRMTEKGFELHIVYSDRFKNKHHIEYCFTVFFDSVYETIFDVKILVSDYYFNEETIKYFITSLLDLTSRAARASSGCRYDWRSIDYSLSS